MGKNKARNGDRRCQGRELQWKTSGQESLSEKVIGYLGPKCPRRMEEPVQQWPCQGGQWPGAEQVKADW